MNDENDDFAEKALLEAVQSTAMLTHLHIRMWGASLNDKGAALMAAAAMGAKASAVRLYKNLMDGADDKLEGVYTIARLARKSHKEMTLPWDDAGPRLLPADSFIDYTTTIYRHKTQFHAAVDEFIASYPADILIAQRNLNQKNDPAIAAALVNAYPDPSELAGFFGYEPKISPIADGKGMRKIRLPEKVATILGDSYEKRMEKSFDEAMSDARKQVHVAISVLIRGLDKREDEKLTFKSAAVENVRDLAPLLRSWNLLKDPRVDALAYDVEKLVAGEDMASIKKNDQVRGFMLKEARRIIETLDNWGDEI